MLSAITELSRKNTQKKAYTIGNINNEITIFRNSLVRLYFFSHKRNDRTDTAKIIPKIEDFSSKKVFAIKK